MTRDEMIAQVAEALEGWPLYPGWGLSAARIAVEALELAGAFEEYAPCEEAEAQVELLRTAYAEVERLRVVRDVALDESGQTPDVPPD